MREWHYMDEEAGIEIWNNSECFSSPAGMGRIGCHWRTSFLIAANVRAQPTVALRLAPLACSRIPFVPDQADPAPFRQLSSWPAVFVLLAEKHESCFLKGHGVAFLSLSHLPLFLRRSRRRSLSSWRKAEASQNSKSSPGGRSEHRCDSPIIRLGPPMWGFLGDV